MRRNIILLLILIFSSLNYAQVDIFDVNSGRGSKSTAVSTGTSDLPNEYTIGGDNDIYINVNVWGEVRRTGYYKVASSTDLLTMLSHTGGPTENANIGAIKIVRINLDKGDESIIYVDMEEFLQTGNYDLIPILKPGDTIVVPGNFMSYFTDFVNVVAKVALVINVYYAVSRISQ